ncbi:hypothetical protein FB45DRAFT_242787 [Roridomyces roridus]|uniref:Uncharacterized protein n=1 Tax=Roridomyces roridus TaxID=1738132 RepID=A0AAD7BAC7_9AGAR|nr:hypothetical protein FB45DRAFT_242787 [Roridomyces roridus]
MGRLEIVTLSTTSFSGPQWSSITASLVEAFEASLARSGTRDLHIKNVNDLPIHMLPRLSATCQRFRLYGTTIRSHTLQSFQGPPLGPSHALLFLDWQLDSYSVKPWPQLLDPKLRDFFAGRVRALRWKYHPENDIILSSLGSVLVKLHYDLKPGHGCPQLPVLPQLTTLIVTFFRWPERQWSACPIELRNLMEQICSPGRLPRFEWVCVETHIPKEWKEGRKEDYTARSHLGTPGPGKYLSVRAHIVHYGSRTPPKIARSPSSRHSMPWETEMLFAASTIFSRLLPCLRNRSA